MEGSFIIKKSSKERGLLGFCNPLLRNPVCRTSLRDRRAGTIVRASLSLFRRCLNLSNSTRRHVLGIQHAARKKTCVATWHCLIGGQRSLEIAIAIEAELPSISKSLLSGVVSPIEIPILALSIRTSVVIGRNVSLVPII